MNNSLRFTPDLFNWAERNAGINVSSIAVLDDDSILLVGKSGLYHLKEGELMQELKFTNYVGTAANQWNWNPGNVLVRGRDSYLISGTFGGVYLLEKENEGIWVVDLLDDKLGKPIRW